LHDGPLLAHERVRSGLFGHEPVDLLEPGVAVPLAMHEQRKNQIRYLREAPFLGDLDLAKAPLGLLGHVGTRPGIEQRELGHPLRRLPHELECDVAAHREADQREARRRGVKDTGRDQAHAIVAGVASDLDRSESPERRYLIGVEARRAAQSGHQQNGYNLAHTCSFLRAKAEKLDSISTCCSAARLTLSRERLCSARTVRS
jgi:hypothetical protein